MHTYTHTPTNMYPGDRNRMFGEMVSQNGNYWRPEWLRREVIILPVLWVS